jgi:ankyrin repeat protein
MRRFKPLLAAALLIPVSGLAQTPPPPKPADFKNADLFIAIADRSPAKVNAAVQSGGDPNARNWLGITPLMWASMVGDLESAKYLIQKGARIDDDSLYGSALTASMISVHDHVGAFLLDRGANPNPKRFDRTTPLMISAGNGSMETFRRLLKKKVDIHQTNDDGATALIFAARGNQPAAVKMLLAAGAKVNVVDSSKRTPLHYAAQDGFTAVTQLLLAKGASVKAVDATGATPLHLAARYSGDPGTVRLLLNAGADRNRKDGRGKTAAELAARRGYTVAAGLLGTDAPKVAAASATPISVPPAASQAIAPAATYIQKGMKEYANKANCTSCHHEGLGLMTLGRLARGGAGTGVDEKLIGMYMGRLAEDGKRGAEAMHAAAADPQMAKMLPAVDIGDFSFAASYFLSAAKSNGVPANPGFAEVALVLGGQQEADGPWHKGLQRGTMQSSSMMTTAMALDVLSTYWPEEKKAEMAQRASRAKTWLAAAKANSAEDLAARVWGLKVAGADRTEVDAAAKQLLAAQKPDGGWGLPNARRSDAYTTGLSLYVLRKMADVPAGSGSIKRAVDFLLRTQDEDGTWYVAKNTGAFNNHFDASFPHGYSQYASFAGTCWAVLGLMETQETRSAQR